MGACKHFSKSYRYGRASFTCLSLGHLCLPFPYLVLPLTATAFFRRRWLRFGCCGKAYPCPICHEISQCEGAIDGVMATRMICGQCSKEQVRGALKRNDELCLLPSSVRV